MNRREVLKAVFIVVSSTRASAAAPAVSTLIGSGSPGYSDRDVNNPYGLTIGPDRALLLLRPGQSADSPPRSENAPDDHDCRQRSESVRRRWRAGNRCIAEHAARDSIRLRRALVYCRARQPRRTESRCEDRRDLHVRRHRRCRDSLATAVRRHEPSCDSRTALPSLLKAGSSSAMSAITVFDRWIWRAASSRPMEGPANGNRRRTARL